MIGMLIYLTTSVLDYALSVTSGAWFVALGGSGYTGGDLPSSGSYAYGSAIIMKRSVTSINVLLFGPSASKPIINGYEGASWTGWRDFSGNSIS